MYTCYVFAMKFIPYAVRVAKHILLKIMPNFGSLHELL